MKNNQGFTLIGVMIIAAILVVIAGIGTVYNNYNAKKIARDSQADKESMLISNVVSASAQEGSIMKTESLQFNDNLPTPAPTPTP